MYRTDTTSLKQNVRFVNERFFAAWSVEMAYILGFFAADGTMYTNRRGAHYIEFVSTDRELIEKVQVLLNARQKIRTVTNPEPWRTAYRLQIGSAALYRDLEILGFQPRKSNVMRFPIVPVRYLKDFVRGYLDGDGCVYFGQHQRNDRPSSTSIFRVQFTSGSKIFLEKLCEALTPRLRGGFITKKNSGYELVYSKHDSIKLLAFLYEGVPTGQLLERKRQVFFRAINHYRHVLPV